MANKTFRRPRVSAGRPTATEPTIVPMRAAATVKPSQKPLRPKTSWRAAVVPEMTAVSKPNRSPPRAAMIVLVASAPVSRDPPESVSVAKAPGL